MNKFLSQPIKEALERSGLLLILHSSSLSPPSFRYSLSYSAAALPPSLLTCFVFFNTPLITVSVLFYSNDRGRHLKAGGGGRGGVVISNREAIHCLALRLTPLQTRASCRPDVCNEFQWRWRLVLSEEPAGSRPRDKQTQPPNRSKTGRQGCNHLSLSLL